MDDDKIEEPQEPQEVADEIDAASAVSSTDSPLVNPDPSSWDCRSYYNVPRLLDDLSPTESSEKLIPNTTPSSSSPADSRSLTSVRVLDEPSGSFVSQGSDVTSQASSSSSAKRPRKVTRTPTASSWDSQDLSRYRGLDDASTNSYVSHSTISGSDQTSASATPKRSRKVRSAASNRSSEWFSNSPSDDFDIKSLEAATANAALRSKTKPSDRQNIMPGVPGTSKSVEPAMRRSNDITDDNLLTPRSHSSVPSSKSGLSAKSQKSRSSRSPLSPQSQASFRHPLEPGQDESSSDDDAIQSNDRLLPQDRSHIFRMRRSDGPVVVDSIPNTPSDEGASEAEKKTDYYLKYLTRRCAVFGTLVLLSCMSFALYQYINADGASAVIATTEAAINLSTGSGTDDGANATMFETPDTTTLD